jgi:hypothetical protein
MAQQIIYPEWRNGNERIKYPFVDSATLTAESGDVLEPDLLLDARLYPIGGQAGLYISSISLDASGMTFHIGDDAIRSRATGFIDFNLPIPDEVPVYDSYERPAGILVSTSERFSLLRNQLPTGETVFSRKATEFVSSCAIPMPQVCLRGLVLNDGSFLTEDVYLVGDNGVVLEFDGDAIVIDLVGDPYASVKVCEEETGNPQTYCGLKTINGIPPDENGEFTFTAGANTVAGGTLDNIIRISQETDGVLRISLAGT